MRRNLECSAVVQGFRERVFSSQLFPFPGPADFRKWISHFQNTVPTDRQSKLCTDRSEEECKDTSDALRAARKTNVRGTLDRFERGRKDTQVHETEPVSDF